MSQKVLPPPMVKQPRFANMTPAQMKQLADMMDKLALLSNVPTKRVVH